MADGVEMYLVPDFVVDDVVVKLKIADFIDKTVHQVNWYNKALNKEQGYVIAFNSKAEKVQMWRVIDTTSTTIK